jgi:hypothetical protein
MFLPRYGQPDADALRLDGEGVPAKLVKHPASLAGEHLAKRVA